MPVFRESELDERMRELVAAHLEQAHGRDCKLLDIQARKLGGGLESLGVHELRARVRTGQREIVRTFVLKRAGRGTPEARLHLEIVPSQRLDLAPNLLAFRRYPAEEAYLFEHIRPSRRWPWGEQASLRLVMESLAKLHERRLLHFAEEGGYERALQERTSTLLRFLENLPATSPARFARAGVAAVRRLSDALPRIRSQLLSDKALPGGLIHGDVHSGNVLLCGRRRGARVVFLDWGRSRHGSPLEDVSSWLQSLGFWEGEARRRHDTLLRGYLEVRGLDSRLTEEIRSQYWLAAACNTLAGAALYHLARAEEAGKPGNQRELAARSLRDCMRVLRRADERWSGGA